MLLGVQVCVPAVFIIYRASEVKERIYPFGFEERRAVSQLHKQILRTKLNYYLLIMAVEVYSIPLNDSLSYGV